MWKNHAKGKICALPRPAQRIHFVTICGMSMSVFVCQDGKVSTVCFLNSAVLNLQWARWGWGWWFLSMHCDTLPGEECQQSSNDCLNNRCQNNAECVDLHQNYTCECGIGFTGQYCENVIQVSKSSKLQCTRYVSGSAKTVLILILKSWLSFQPCDSNPCNPNATLSCTNIFPGGYFCACQMGWGGLIILPHLRKCIHTAWNLLHEGPLGPWVFVELHVLEQFCLPVSAGDNCESNIDDCIGHRCQNGGTCNDLINDYNCTCLPNYFGPRWVIS